MASSLRIGAAWWRVDKNGNHYLSGKVNVPVPVLIAPDQPIHLYANPYKQEGDQQPDFELVILPIAEGVPGTRESGCGPSSADAPRGYPDGPEDPFVDDGLARPAARPASARR